MKNNLLPFILTLFFPLWGWGQTTVFSDDFSTDQSATWSTTGQIGSSAFSVSRSGADWGARRNTSPAQLELTNDASGTSNAAGWVFANTATAGFSAPYNTTLSSNPGLVTWYFNMRQIRSDPAGFATGSYGVALILGCSGTTPNNAGNGYAVVLGQSGSTDPIRLARFSGGLASTTNLITSNTNGLTDFGAEYVSCKVTYDPSNHQWELFLRNDGTSAFADPRSGTLVSQGTATDNTYTSDGLDYLGGYWQGSTAGSQTAFFDNISVQVGGIVINPSTLSGFLYQAGSGPSDAQSFTVYGNVLSNDITLTASDNLEISLTSGSGYTASIVLPQSGGNVSPTTVYVRLKAGLNAGNYTAEYITATSDGMESKTLTCSGMVYGTYTWAGSNNATWAVSTNWSPERLTPTTKDVLQFNDGTTKTITELATETIERFIVSNNTKISLQSTGGATLTIAGGAGDDLVVESGCELNYTSYSTNYVVISLSSGATGLISGSMYLNGGYHKLTGKTASSIRFVAGSVFTFHALGNAFGDETENSVVFESGSTYIHESGSDPFGKSAPNSVVVFETGSLYIHKNTAAPSLSGRTYADFEINQGAINLINLTGTAPLTMDNYAVKAGTFYLNLTGGIFINGHISVSTGATLGFSPTSASNLTLDATGQQEISGGGTLVFGANCNVIVDAGSETVIKRNVSIGGNLTVNSGGSFVVDPSQQLTVTGTLTNNGSFTIKSDATGTGSLIHSTANVAAKVERYIAAASWGTEDDGWHQISSPVADQLIVPEFVASYTLGNEDFYKWDEATNLWINIKNADGSGKNPGFSEVDFVTGRGYFAAYQNTDTKEFTGNLNVSDVTVGALTLSSGENSGWHLLGNPFASALTWYTDWSLTNIGGVANIWNRTAKSYSPVNAGEPIPAMNGFLVKVTAAPGSVTIPAAKRTHSAQAWYKNSDYPVIRLLAYNLDYPSYQESQVRFNPMSSEGFDNEFDGRFLPGYAPRFYSLVDGKKCMVNSMPSLSAETEILFDFILNKGSNFSIEASGLDNLPATAYLNDLKTGTVHNLSQNPVYTFTAAEGDAPNRFKLTFGSVGIDTPAGKPIAAYYAAGRLHFVNAQAEKTIEVFNMAGQRFIFAKTTANEYPVNLSAGMYVVKVSTAQQLVSAKFFVK